MTPNRNNSKQKIAQRSQQVSSLYDGLIADSLINFKKEQIDFNFTHSDLNKIIYQKWALKNLKFSPELLADLRYYCLCQNSNALDFQLIFTTYYLEQQQKIAVIRSIISLQGKISQQISSNFLKNPQLLNDLIISHYWLINQLCDRLPLKYNSKTSLITWGLALIIVLIIAPLLFYFVATSWLIKLIILMGLFCLLLFLISAILKKYLASFILQQLLFGFLAKNVANRRLGFMLLRYFG